MAKDKQSTPEETVETPQATAAPPADSVQVLDLKRKVAELEKQNAELRAGNNGLSAEVVKDARQRQAAAGGAMTWEQCVEVALRNARAQAATQTAAQPKQ